MKEDTEWTMEIHSRSGWFNIDLAELWRYRDLIILFVRREFVAVYKQTILGPVWFLLPPLFTAIVFAIIFGSIARIPTDGQPPVLFYLAGIIAWTYFSNCMTATSNTFIANSGIFGKVYFPRLVIPVSIVIVNIFSFLIQFGLFLIIYLYYLISGAPISPNIWLCLVPFLLIQMAALGLGMGILVSSLTTRYRDLTFALGCGIQLWMYATPIVYPLSQVPHQWIWLISLNPMTAVVESFRFAFLGSGMIQSWQIVLSLIITAFILFLGILFFSKVERSFMDTV